MNAGYVDLYQEYFVLVSLQKYFTLAIFTQLQPVSSSASTRLSVQLIVKTKAKTN
jgi:hypothetical protein